MKTISTRTLTILRYAYCFELSSLIFSLAATESVYIVEQNIVKSVKYVGYERIFLADNGSWVDILPDLDKCHNGTLEQFEKFKVKVYTGIKFEIMCKSCQNMYMYQFLVSYGFRKYFYLLPICLSLELLEIKVRG